MVHALVDGPARGKQSDQQEREQALTITQPFRAQGWRCSDANPASPHSGRRRAVPEAEAELEPAQARTGVRPVRAIEGPPYKFTHRQTGAVGFVCEKCVLAVREDHMCAPAHG